MIIYKKDLKQGFLSLLVWTILLSSMLGMIILIYPEMKTQMAEISSSFSEMGSFTAVFGMNSTDFSKFQDFFGIESDSIMGLIGALYASLTGIHILACEEGGHTAEFLLTHPVTRARIFGEKILALITQITILDLAATGFSFLLITFTNEEIETDKVLLLFLGYYLMHLELALISAGVSAFLRKNLFGLGIGIAAAAYFLNIMSNLIEELDFLKYITPFGYTSSSSVLHDGTLEAGYISCGFLISLFFIAAGFHHWCRKEFS